MSSRSFAWYVERDAGFHAAILFSRFSVASRTMDQAKQGQLVVSVPVEAFIGKSHLTRDRNQPSRQKKKHFLKNWAIFQISFIPCGFHFKARITRDDWQFS